MLGFFFFAVKQFIGIVQAIVFLPAYHYRSSAPFLNGVPIFDCRKNRMAKEKQTAQYPANAKIVRFAVSHLIFDQRAYLSIYQPVKLRQQDEMITVFPVLGEKIVPLVPVFCIPGAAVKDHR